MSTVWKNMPEPNSELYTDTQRAAYNLIKDNPEIDECFKLNPLTATNYIYNLYKSLIEDLNSFHPHQGQVIVSRTIAEARGFNKAEVVEYIHMEPKTPLRIFTEHIYMDLTGANEDEIVEVTSQGLYTILHHSSLINNLWSFICDNSNLYSSDEIDDSDTQPFLMEFFREIQRLTAEEFDEFIEGFEYSEHEAMELKLLFVGTYKFGQSRLLGG